MPKVNIYLPDELADEAREAKLSLSPVCQRAIRDELEAIRVREAATADLHAVAARLNATIEEEDIMDRAEGHEDGAEWARNWATYGELRHIAEEFEPGRGGNFDAEHSICAFLGAKSGETVVSVGHEDGSLYWDGFIDGAREVLNAVSPLLDR